MFVYGPQGHYTSSENDTEEEDLDAEELLIVIIF